jgi:hypothetical protein
MVKASGTFQYTFTGSDQIAGDGAFVTRDPIATADDFGNKLASGVAAAFRAPVEFYFTITELAGGSPGSLVVVQQAGWNSANGCWTALPVQVQNANAGAGNKVGGILTIRVNQPADILP